MVANVHHWRTHIDALDIPKLRFRLFLPPGAVGFYVTYTAVLLIALVSRERVSWNVEDLRADPRFFPLGTRDCLQTSLLIFFLFMTYAAPIPHLPYSVAQ